MKTKSLFNTFGVIALMFLASCTGCNRVQPNYEGVLMTNYGRNGQSDFKLVTGAQGPLWFGSELYEVPMFEQKADPPKIGVTAKDAGYFNINPTYAYQPIRSKGADIVFNYKHVGLGDELMDNLEKSILDPIVLNAYREIARDYTTDSLMNHMNTFEKQVEKRLENEFGKKFFTLTQLTSGLQPPQSMSQAIENRNNAIQKAEQLKNELQVARMDLEKAKIDAEANRIRTEGLSSKNLTEKWIEAIRTTNNKVIITDGKTPVILGQ